MLRDGWLESERVSIVANVRCGNGSGGRYLIGKVGFRGYAYLMTIICVGISVRIRREHTSTVIIVITTRVHHAAIVARVGRRGGRRMGASVVIVRVVALASSSPQLQVHVLNVSLHVVLVGEQFGTIGVATAQVFAVFELVFAAAVC